MTSAHMPIEDFLAFLRPDSEAALGEAMEDGNRNTCWDDSQEAIQMQNCLRKESRQHNLTGWFELRRLIARHPRLRHFAFNDLWSAACYAYRYDSHRFDCYWKQDGQGRWMVFVILQAEHVLNRRGRSCEAEKGVRASVATLTQSLLQGRIMLTYAS